MGNIIKGAITVGVLFFAVIVAYGLVKTAPEPEQIAPEEMATSIRVIEVERSPIRLEVTSQGTVVPHKESELIPEVNGRVSWVSPNLVAGGYFKADDVLLKIDDRDYRSMVARAQATLSRARAEEELARYELGRMEELVKKKLTSQSSLENVLRNHRIAKAALQDSQIALEQANRDLNRTEIRAPYEGLVRTEKVDLGQYLSRGQSIASIYGSESAEVRLPVADLQLAYLDLPLGHRGELSGDLAPDVLLSTDYGGKHYEWVGKLVRTEAEIDSKSRMVTAVVRVRNAENPDQPDLPVGLFVNASIKGRAVDNVVTLPRAALRNQNQVLIVDGDSRLHYRGVEIMRFENDNVLISGGLNSGDIVNVSPLQTVIEGMRVNTISQPANG
ncbi:MAG: efflux RND transporter periplasmic adaptor subunit [Pseudomonadales bacterium]|nr:efflux RND transporter periplasmic adaptor subunit [Pseudomonadales bacterium]MBO6595650.1 efflux RND transporter periplasmic adaptor subunit [Pseudomonadales bacterium]MBO6655719.1 efflux RND transporter periplasmic adaptor subunit [Pseudomonadales bacterium]MBO6702150.1 efflux RND transporter periplasmic adaptor subunit [Pseudomonadales bacterium]MBO6820792.1 efflux RND transporter periplasmic adaptor subunit [Pseudomonadales bacterium]